MIQQLDSLEFSKSSKKTAPGLSMILPGHLSELLDLALPGHVLLIDLRTATEFERSHVHGAANMRAPTSFLRDSSLEVIESVLNNDESRKAFSSWQTARCIVFYARALESPRECPAADTLTEKFVSRGWNGEVYLLKGHYREFSTSFARHIGGARMSEEGREHLESLRRRTFSKEDIAKSEADYEVWRKAREAEDLGTGPYPPVDPEKREAMDRQEQELELAFRERFPHLYGPEQKAKDDFGDAKAQMVGHLDRGLTKMREASHNIAAPQRAPGHEKATGEYLEDRRLSEGEYVDVSRERHKTSTGEGELGGRGGGSLIGRVFRRS